MKHRALFLRGWTGGVGRIAPPPRSCAIRLPHPEAALTPLLEKPFVFAVLEHVYRWHFDQSYILEAGKLDTLEVWARRLHPQLDAGDRSEFAELWIPAVNTRVELKRSDYFISEMNLAVVDRSFKVKHVTRQLQPRRAFELPNRIVQPGGGAGPSLCHASRQVALERYPADCGPEIDLRVSWQGPPVSLYRGPSSLRGAGLRCVQRSLGVLGNRSKNHALFRRHEPLQSWFLAAQPTAPGCD